MNFHNIFRYSLFAVVAFLLAGCSKRNTIVLENELEGLQLATTITNEHHTLLLYTANGKFLTGFNQVYFQIKNKDGSLATNATATWEPMMQMISMSHSCPNSLIGSKVGSLVTYGGHIVFQMASNESEFWKLKINYTLNGSAYTVEDKIKVEASTKRTVESFQATDGKRYVMALVQPTTPRVAVNDMKAVLYRMESMMNFVAVDSCKIKLDPRMPGMGNHTSPNNVDLTQTTDGMYQGNLSLTMTGYWKLNLQLQNNLQEIIKGEAITSTNEGSSIYFELEF